MFFTRLSLSLSKLSRPSQEQILNELAARPRAVECTQHGAKRVPRRPRRSRLGGSRGVPVFRVPSAREFRANRDPSPPPRSPHPLAPLPPSEGRTEAPVGTPQFPSPLGGPDRGVEGPRSSPRIAATLRIAGRATRGMPRAPDPAQARETNLRGEAALCGPKGGNEADYGDRLLTPPFLRSQRAPSDPPALGPRGRRPRYPTRGQRIYSRL